MLRRILEHAMQRLIEAEAATQIGAQPDERASTCTTYRNGYRERVLDTGSGRLELQIPKLRTGSFFPTLLEPRRRIDRAPLAVVQEAYVLGISTRKVDDTRYLRVGTGAQSACVSWPAASVSGPGTEDPPSGPGLLLRARCAVEA